MPVLLEALATVLVAILLLWLAHLVYRKYRPLPLLNLTITKVSQSYNRTYTVRCGVCGATSECDIQRDTVFPVLKCYICGEGGALRRVQRDMRKRLDMEKKRVAKEAADKLRAEKAEHDSIKEGGRKLDL